ncbi:type II secretion system protein [Prosthecobacter debontii]|nr:prepilin-type N-terminal cleavage/methylation domain-containing protein [Prosthecobacter debontii]
MASTFVFASKLSKSPLQKIRFTNKGAILGILPVKFSFRLTSQRNEDNKVASHRAWVIIIITPCSVIVSPRHQASLPSMWSQAFSLVEMLIVIAIVGVMSAVVIAFLGGAHRESMTRVRDQRNAQEVVSLCMGAVAVGAPVVEPGNMRTTIENLMEGKAASSGIFQGRIFRISQMSEEEIDGALKYLSWHDSQPVYDAKAH